MVDPGTTQPDNSSPADGRHDLVIVGAGFAGLYMLYRARRMGLDTVVLEAGDGVGGTWYWNRYPGARCDVESMEYSYDFDEALQQEWEWSERYAGQPEILRYANHVADRFDLRRDIVFDTRVETVFFDEDTTTWEIGTDSGSTFTSRFVVMATGCLSSANEPDFVGKADFAGRTFHTGRWPKDGVDFGGRRVAVIGTGSSAIQAIPEIARQAGQLTVLQRTATYSVPARNGPLSAEEQESIKARYRDFRAANRTMNAGFGSTIVRRDVSALTVAEEELIADFEKRWEQGGFGFLSGFNDFMLDRRSNELAAQFVRDKIVAIVEDPATAAALMPSQVIGCKRLCLDSGYYETFNRDNVSLVDLAEDGIARMVPAGIELDSGRVVEVDDIVFATGFDAMTGTLLAMDIRGVGGQTLREKWSAGPRTYLGLSVPGFPNLFTVSGPGSPSVLTNMIVSIQQHVDWISDCLADMRDARHDRIEATVEAENDWVQHVNSVADLTLFPTCNSWYLGANVPGKERVFMPLIGFPDYVARCDRVAAEGYPGFIRS
jgi:cyclohexanone monooxygenase